jgi:hypothetical protein
MLIILSIATFGIAFELKTINNVKLTRNRSEIERMNLLQEFSIIVKMIGLNIRDV